MMIADLETLDRRQIKLGKLAKGGDKEARFQIEVIDKLIASLNDNQLARSIQWKTEAEKTFVESLNLLTNIPVLYVCNILDPADANSALVQAVKDHAAEEGAEVAHHHPLENRFRDFHRIDCLQFQSDVSLTPDIIHPLENLSQIRFRAVGRNLRVMLLFVVHQQEEGDGQGNDLSR